MVIQPARQPMSLSLRFLGGVVFVLALTLAIFTLMMRPELAVFQTITLFLSGTALASLFAGFMAYRWGWLGRSLNLQWALYGSYLLAALLTFVNVWVVARLMFINQHDLTLATILLIFATGIAGALGYYLSAPVTDSITALARAARSIERGHLETRVEVQGGSEVGDLARAFNQMAAQLETAAHNQRELDTLRRDLIAWVGHDLRTPLASVRAIVEALADGVVTDTPTVDRYLRTAKRDIGALALLIDDLFEMAQIDAGGIKLEWQPVALSDLISDTLESFSAQAFEKNIALGGEVAPDVDPVQCDARQVGRVLNNLVGNALRHTPAGGQVTVDARTSGDAVRVVVRDTGEGIPADDLPHIFERFYRSEKSRSRVTGGAGLGLAIAKGIVDAHGGRMEVSSTAGRGTQLVFVLPRVTALAGGRPVRPLAARPGNPLLPGRNRSVS